VRAPKVRRSCCCSAAVEDERGEGESARDRQAVDTLSCAANR
jgi:hypothetical protein